MSGRSREEYRPLNVRDALSYLDQVKVSLSQKSFMSLHPTTEML
jgi:histone deacetylase complex regulatory component SIN3